ncbi:MAG: glycoside hydrolase family 57 protein [Candidatus Nanoarchaeia archaeon]|nr:glycoside hydrolase family 57 protein [Candidatus Nanoarchaeia archaeon]
MAFINFYFNVHQPIRIRHYRIFDIGKNHNYFNDGLNREVFERIEKLCYIPMNSLLMKLNKKYQDKFKVNFGVTGSFLEQLEEYGTNELKASFKELLSSNFVEIVSETYYHSLSSLYSEKEFVEQIKHHYNEIERKFQKKPRIFRNTELILNKEILDVIENLGYDGFLCEGKKSILKEKTENSIYSLKDSEMKVFFRNCELSDDLAYKFIDRNSKDYPLNPSKYIKKIEQLDGEIFNIFIDYETFGEHIKDEDGVFNFFEEFVEKFIELGNEFKNFSDYTKKPKYSIQINENVSWADKEKDHSAWCENRMQQSALEAYYDLEDKIKKTKDQNLLENWRKLGVSDNFYYMSTKTNDDDQEVHSYFSHYDVPYDAYIDFRNILSDLQEEINDK